MTGWLYTIPWPLFALITGGAFTAAFIAFTAAFTAWARRQQRRDMARILHEDRVMAIVAPWHYAPCGCGWADTDPVTVRVCRGHWLDLYRASDYFHFDRELST